MKTIPVFWYELPKGWTEDDLKFVFGSPTLPLPFAELHTTDLAEEEADLTKKPSDYAREILEQIQRKKPSD
jgi:hypothetical protein